MRCKIVRLEDNQLKKYDCHSIKLLMPTWIKEYRKEFIDEVNRILDKCKCLEEEFCDICAKEDHEGRFCRCENRNMALAKYLRTVK